MAEISMAILSFWAGMATVAFGQAGSKMVRARGGSMAILSFWAGLAIVPKVNALIISAQGFARMAIPNKKSGMAIRWSIHQVSF